MLQVILAVWESWNATFCYYLFVVFNFFSLTLIARGIIPKMIV